MKAVDSSQSIHNITHILLPLFLSSIFIVLYYPINPYDVTLVSFFGSLLPDVDHINIWLEYKFRNFFSFLRFLSKARRYRYSFLIFHNLGSIIALIFLITIIRFFSPLGTVFLVSFLSHLILDFFNDRFNLGRVTHWRYRRKT